jgi:6-phosphogluconolactonase/glucosamine-6-phosphate isomerase/deaminase
LPVLNGKSVEETTLQYGETIRELFAKVDYKIGFFGIGPDGHTAGILPGSIAESATTTTVSYQAEKFLRVTITKPVIGSLDEAIVYAIGENKWPIVEALSGTMERAEWPAMSLKQARRLTLFTDYLGETK